jgi:hypothetical protein
MEEYLTTEELSARIKYSKQTLYNKIHDEEFVLGEHYVKPSRKKILFKWSAIQVWLEEPSSSEDTEDNPTDEQTLGDNPVFPDNGHPDEPSREENSPKDPQFPLSLINI